MRSRPVAAAAILIIAALLVGCAATPAPELPPAGAIDYQLGGGYAPAQGVVGVARDSTDVPAAGLYSICYVNGFQTQPADRDTWLLEHPDLVLRHDGEPVIDENWPDELIVDASTAAKRERIADIIGATLDRCADAGFDAIEIDNLDSYTRSDGALTAENAIALARLYADRAHSAGLAIAQKNSVELGTRGRDDAGFDFAVAEECYRYDECARYSAVYGDHVIDIEYADDLRGTFDDACDDTNAARSTILRDRDLVTPDSPDYVFASC